MVGGGPGIVFFRSGCTGRPDRTVTLPPMTTYGVVLGRTGCHGVRRPDTHVLLDQSTCLFGWPGLEVDVYHALGPWQPHSSTLITFPAAVLGEGDDPAPLPTMVHPAADAVLAHYRLLALVQCEAADPELVMDLTVDLLDRLRRDGNRPGSGAAFVGPGARSVVRDAQAALLVNPRRDLTELAVAVGSSRSELCRLFRRYTGQGVAAYRAAVRTSRVLDGLADGVGNLTDLAVATGFADHAHMARTIRSQFGATPSTLRRLLSEGDLPPVLERER